VRARITKTTFVTSVYKISQLPTESLPEIAFAGRSNVGKSCLLNRLLGRHNLVKVSSQPGYTRSLNFFLVNDSVYFVDLPGYGFAKVPKYIQRQWQSLVETYITRRKSLDSVVCIFDIRRIPDQLDLNLLKYLSASGKHIILVLNKADKISQPKRQKQIQAICQQLPQFFDRPLIISARTGEGVQSLLEAIWSRLGF
jgi:GTP-binding protein